MKTWSALNSVPCPEWAPAELKAGHANLETERQSIVAERAGIDAERARLESIGAAEAIAEMQSGSLRLQAASCMQRELAYRDQVEAFLQAVIPASGDELTASHEALQAVEAEVAKWLERGPKNLGGYNTPVEGAHVHGAWTREFILRHPAVLAARARCNDGAANWAHDHRQANAAAGELTLDKLGRLKAAALAV